MCASEKSALVEFISFRMLSASDVCCARRERIKNHRHARAAAAGCKIREEISKSVGVDDDNSADIIFVPLMSSAERQS